MEDTDIYNKLGTIFEDVFDEEVELTPDKTADDVEGWDSLTHVQLLVTVEKEFGVSFSSNEIANLPDVGSLVALIKKHAS